MRRLWGREWPCTPPGSRSDGAFLGPRQLSQRRTIATQLDVCPTRRLPLRRPAIELPVRPQGLHDLVEVVGEAKDAMGRENHPALLEVAQHRGRPRHLEAQ